MIRPDPIGMLDLGSGLLLLYTVSPIPEVVAATHAYFLLVKGGGTMLTAPIFPLPVFILGGAADVISAAILLTGQPPVFGGFKEIIAGALFLKGVLSLVTLMG